MNARIECTNSSIMADDTDRGVAIVQHIANIATRAAESTLDALGVGALIARVNDLNATSNSLCAKQESDRHWLATYEKELRERINDLEVESVEYRKESHVAAQIERALERFVESGDFDEAVEKQVNDSLTSALDEHDFSRDIESALRDHDFDDAIESALDSYDFDRAIERSGVADKVNDLDDRMDAIEERADKAMTESEQTDVRITAMSDRIDSIEKHVSGLLGIDEQVAVESAEKSVAAVRVYGDLPIEQWAENASARIALLERVVSSDADVINALNLRLTKLEQEAMTMREALCNAARAIADASR